MVWFEDKSIKFVNPYNFISLDSKCAKKNYSEYINDKKLLTGYINCELENQTLIFIPNTTNDTAFGNNSGNLHKSYDFYSYDNISNEDRNNKYSEPVIPSSEIRGVIRSAYEALTNSCLSTIDDKRILSKRTTMPANPGILQKINGIFKLYKAERVMLKVKDCSKDPVNSFKSFVDKHNEGDVVYIKKGGKYYIKKAGKNGGKTYINFTVSDISDEKQQGLIEGYLHIGEDFIRKHHESVFIKCECIENININGDDIEKLKKQIEIYKENGKSHYGKYEKLLKDFNSGKKCLPVYYHVYGKNIYLSPACIGREIFFNKISDILMNQGNYQPCVNKKNLCPACALFGFVSDGKNKDSLASRLRFTDATINNKLNNYKDYYLDNCILPELATPKITATEFYLKRPYEGKKTFDIWNYDYAFNWKGSKDIEYYQEYIPKINGRKYYWHHKSCKTTNEANERNCTIRPLKNNMKFQFKIYFDSVTKEELENLIWTLNIGSNNNKNCHKIGRGKSIGYGTIKIRVIDVKCRDIKIDDKNIIYNINNYNIDLNNIDIFDTNVGYIKEFLRITDFSNSPNDISYPIGEDTTKNINDKNRDASHQWFLGNRMTGKSNYQTNYKNGKQIVVGGSRPIINKSLPKITESDIELPKYKK